MPLGVGRDDERHDREREADEDLAERGGLEEAAEGGIDDQARERDKGEDEQRIDRLDLALQPLHAEERAVHLLRLLHPRAAGLVEEGPEHRDQQVKRHDSCDGGQSLPREGLGEECGAARRDVHEAMPSQPEHEGRDRHENAGHAERPARPRPGQQPRRQEGREEGAEVDREVEPAEDALQQVAVRLAELISDVGRHARLDAAGAQRDEQEPGEEPAARLERGLEERPRGVHEGEAEVPRTVDERQQDDREILAEKRVGDDAADHGDKVGSGHEEVHPLPGLGFRHVVRSARRRVEVLGHEDDEDRLHAVEREAFGGLVADDERDAGRHPCRGDRLGAEAMR